MVRFKKEQPDMKSCIALAVLCLTVALSGCSGSKELTREKAAELIKSGAMQAIAVEQGHPGQWEVKPQKNAGLTDRDLEYLRPLEKAGWVSLKVLSRTPFVNSVDVELTEKGVAASHSWKQDQFGKWLIPTMEQEFVEITGITNPEPTHAIAEYSWRWTPNQQGKDFGEKPSEIQTATARFELFDDGWRIAQ
jgi:hypothetical protein